MHKVTYHLEAKITLNNDSNEESPWECALYTNKDTLAELKARFGEWLEDITTDTGAK